MRKRKRPKPDIGLSDEFIDKIANEADRLAGVLCNKNGLDGAYLSLFEKLGEVYDDATIRLALAEDCLKQSESYKRYLEKAKGFSVEVE